MSSFQPIVFYTELYNNRVETNKMQTLVEQKYPICKCGNHMWIAPGGKPYCPWCNKNRK